MTTHGRVSSPNPANNYDRCDHRNCHKKARSYDDDHWCCGRHDAIECPRGYPVRVRYV